jgi:UDP-N-acetylmuramate dehydrogenase
VHERRKAQFDIAYRHCRSPREEWFAAAWFSLSKGDEEASRARIKQLLAKRIATQPLQLPNAGSVFRNPPGDHAARLIESCGLKGLQRGGARISEKHANFIVNPEGAASAADIEWLIAEAKRVVLEKTGVELIPEVRIVGEPA